MLKGIDISKWQDNPATPAIEVPSFAGLSFIVLRASIAETKDTRYDHYYAAARKAGLIVMAYHFGYGEEESAIDKQVALFLEVAKDADFLWLDQERAGFSDAEAQKFIDGVRAAGRPCGLYHSASGFSGVKADAKWVADWRDESEAAGYPRTTSATPVEFPGWDLWQYDGGGADGIDNDYANPDRPLAKLLRLGYVTQAQLDAANTANEVMAVVRDEAIVEAAALRQELGELQAADDKTIGELQTQLAAAKTELLAFDAQVTKLTTDLAEVQGLLAAAPAAEKERIALAAAGAVAERIRSL